MSVSDIKKEIFFIVEKKLLERKITRYELDDALERLKELISLLPEGVEKNNIIQKIQDKSRFAPYINDTGILDFTGYGEHFW